MSNPFDIDCPSCRGIGIYAGNGEDCQFCGTRGYITVVKADKLDKVRQFALNLSNNNDRGWLSSVGDDLLELLEEKHD